MSTFARKMASAGASLALGAGILTFAGAAPANAAGPNHSVGPYKTYTACKNASRSYNSSWTRVSMSCRYIPKDGGFTASGYWFWWRAVS